MNQEAFHNLSTFEVAQLVRADGPKVCVFPFNGTRRWFMLEYAQPGEDFATAYLEAITRRLVEIYQLLFEYGIDTILMPLLSPRLFTSRGEEYTHMAIKGLARLVDRPLFLDMYREYEVRVRFYGDYEQCFATTPFVHLSAAFDQLTADTLLHARRRIFWGICAHEATETTASLAVQYYQENGRTPDKRALIEMYYGEYISHINFFISSTKLRAFDMPLIATGKEDLYFTVVPSPYFTKVHLRNILYDHLFSRRKDDSTYHKMQPEDWSELHSFYALNQDKTLGVGNRKKQWGLWYPQPQVTLPEGFQDE
ncbi:MAG: hypothetical protein GY803_15155 [Chloroflexi bacterium]|nr:hypothetical protein [Chloroflexota bacterium]